MSFKAVIFDYGGVLSREGADDFWDRFESHFGGKAVHEKGRDLIDQLKRGQLDDESFIKLLSERMQVPVTISPDELWQITPHFLIDSDMQAFVRELQVKGYQTALLSNVFPLTRQQLEAAGCYDDFDIKILSCEVGFAKPDKEVYDLVLDELKVPPEACVFVDDQERCLVPARERDITAVLAVDKAQIIRDVKRILSLS